mgnify:CR=1 FL=1
MSRVGLLIVLFFISGFTVAQESVPHPPAVDEASRPFEDGKDYFLHFSNIEKQGFKTVLEGERVSFEVENSDRGPQATKIVSI